MTSSPGLFSGMDFHDPDRSEIVRAPLNYMGTKWDSLDFIYPKLPRSNTFVDVCSGSGQVLLGRGRSTLEVMNDRNSGIVAFYRCLQDKFKMEQLVALLATFPHSRELFKDCSDNWQLEQDTLIRAAKWYYLIQSSFGGKGQYFGRVTKGKSNIWNKLHSNIELFDHVHERLKGVLIENCDWRTIVKDFDSDETVFYFDPPYFFANVYFHNFSRDDHREMVKAIFECKGFVALSGYPDPIYDSAPWDEKHVLDVKELAVSKAHNHFIDKPVDDQRSEVLYIKDFG